MLVIDYDPIEGKSWPDGKVKDQVLLDYSIATKYDRVRYIVVVGTSLYVDAARAAINTGEFDRDQVEFVYNGVTLDHDENGRISYWPEGFCDIPILINCKLLAPGGDYDIS